MIEKVTMGTDACECYKTDRPVCPYCGKVVKIEDVHDNYSMKCPHCGRTFWIQVQCVFNTGAISNGKNFNGYWEKGKEISYDTETETGKDIEKHAG